MVDRNLIREFSVDERELDATFGESLKEVAPTEAEMDLVYDATSRSFDVNEIIEGHVLSINGDEVLVDIGYKSEGIVTLDEWEDGEEKPNIGDTIQVLLEEVEDDYGLILLSKRKADRVREWEDVTSKHQEGDVVTGLVVRKIKGGLLVDIGVNVFLPASQVDIRRPPDIGEFIGKKIQCVILKIDDSRRNIVVSRRKLIEDQRAERKRKLMDEIEEGQLRKGVVKNIAECG
ncbi:MAG: S1 RNA-binding domain-containing protein, partial [Planctomycetaceae bacterium]